MNDQSQVTIKRVVLVVSAMASFLVPFMASSINIALPSIGREFEMSAILLSWVATAYLLTSAVFLVPFGKMADIRGRKKVFTIGISIYTFASFLAVFSSSATWLITFRVLQGIGGAMIFSTSVAMLTSVYPLGERGKVLGINVSSTYLGLSLGPILGGIFTEHVGWQSLFLVNTILGLIILALVLWKLRGEWAEARNEKFDFIGSLGFGLTLTTIMIGFSLLPKIIGGELLVLGVIGIFIFFRLETRAKNPVLNLSLFRKNTVFAFSNLAALINYSATFAVGFFLSLYLQYIKGKSPQQAGLILIAQPVVMAIFSPLAGKLSDKIEPRLIASAGMALSAIGLLLLNFLGEQTTLVFIVSSLMLLGFGFAFFSSPNTNAVMSSIEKRFYGVGSAMLATMRLTGQMFSMGLAVLIFAFYIGRAQINPSNYPAFLASLKTGFILFAGLCFGGVFASLARGKLR